MNNNSDNKRKLELEYSLEQQNNDSDSDWQEQPLKKPKIELENTLEQQLLQNNEVEVILKQYNFTDWSLINFITIYNLFEKYSQYPAIRLQTVIYFNEYHKKKAPQMIDVDGYIKFIVNVFFDPDDIVFNQQFNQFSAMESTKLLKDIYKKIIEDKRFNQSDRYKIRLDILKCSKIDEEISSPSDFSEDSNDEINNKQYYLPDILIGKLIIYLLLDRDKSDTLYGYQIEYLSLVSKQFFKVLSKILIENDSRYPWIALPIKLNSKWCLINQPPIFMNYESIKYIKYDTTIEEFHLIFSKVETFRTDSDEFEHTMKGATYRDTFDYYESYSVKHYQELVLSNGYLVYPPPMPSLKNLIIDKYYGYENNYSNLISYIITNNSKPNINQQIKQNESYSYYEHYDNVNSPDCYIKLLKSFEEKNEIQPKGTIEHFKITIEEWDDIQDTIKDTKFFKDLLIYHSNSLKTITIENLSLVDITEFLEFYKHFIPHNSNIQIILLTESGQFFIKN